MTSFHLTKLSDHRSAMSDLQPCISIRDVGIVFESREREPIVAVEHISIDVPDGKIVGIVGPSGCGKTTLLNVVSGLLVPTTGETDVRGRPVTKIRNDVGYMFARDGLMPWRTALGNVEFGLEVRKVPNARDVARDWLRKVGLGKFEAHYRHELSQGMRQRVAIARTFAIEPDILLMDEPFGALDSQTRLNLQELFLSVWDRTKKTVLFVTHDLHEAIFLSDIVIVFTNRPGKVKSVIPINLPRPRMPPAELASSAEYQHLYSSIWREIKDEVHQFS
jgi:NitT/TauT family transport system ATP-binding protein